MECEWIFLFSMISDPAFRPIESGDEEFGGLSNTDADHPQEASTSSNALDKPGSNDSDRGLDEGTRAALSQAANRYVLLV